MTSLYISHATEHWAFYLSHGIFDETKILVRENDHTDRNPYQIVLHRQVTEPLPKSNGKAFAHITWQTDVTHMLPHLAPAVLWHYATGVRIDSAEFRIWHDRFSGYTNIAMNQHMWDIDVENHPGPEIGDMMYPMSVNNGAIPLIFKMVGIGEFYNLQKWLEDHDWRNPLPRHDHGKVNERWIMPHTPELTAQSIFNGDFWMAIDPE